MPVLSRDELNRRLFSMDLPDDNRLTVTPLLDKRQIGDASIDVRLSSEFIIIRHTNLASVDPTRDIDDRIGQYQELVRVQYGEPFVLHPNHLVLGSTLEYVALPDDLTAQVIGRSSWGRLGLIIATATAVAPNFKGAITLELVNFGQAPLVLYPGVSIAQLVIETVTERATYTGRYSCPTGPQYSRIHRDKDIRFWSEPSNFL